MTTVHEIRMTRQGKPYDAIVPLSAASPATYDAYVAETLREWLHKRGTPCETLSNDDLLTRVRASVVESR